MFAFKPAPCKKFIGSGTEKEFDCQKSPVVIFFEDGSRKSFKSLDALIEFYGPYWLLENMGTNFKQYTHSKWLDYSWFDSGFHVIEAFRVPVYRNALCIIRDSFGEVISEQEVHDFIYHRQRQANVRFFDSFYGPQDKATALGLPVAGAGKSSKRRYFRRPQTSNERKLAQRLCPEDVMPRAKRSVNTIPEAHDDQFFSTLGHRSWKRHRRTQWKEKN